MTTTLTGIYQGANQWRIKIQLKPECGIWVGTAVASCEAGNFSVIKAKRYEQTAESVQIAVTELLYETITKNEKRGY